MGNWLRVLQLEGLMIYMGWLKGFERGDYILLQSIHEENDFSSWK